MRNKWIKEIKGMEIYKGYKIYEDGTVESYSKRSNDKKGHVCYVISDEPQRVLKPMINHKGYLKVELSCKGFYVHRLVALAFIPNPDNKPQINHIDCDKFNNNISNLEWCTNSENNKHKCEHGLNHPPKGDKHYSKNRTGALHHCSKKVEQYTLNGELVHVFDCVRDAAKFFEKDPSGISKCCHGHKKTAFGFIWRYK